MIITFKEIRHKKLKTYKTLTFYIILFFMKVIKINFYKYFHFICINLSI